MLVDKKALVFALALGLLATVAVAQDLSTDLLFRPTASQQRAGGGCEAQQQPVLLPGVENAEVFLFALPAKLVGSDRQQLALSVLDGDREILRETFTVTLPAIDGDLVVFEAFAEHRPERQMLQRWIEQGADRYSVRLSIDGKSVSRMSIADFAAQSLDVRQLATLPVAARSEVLRPSSDQALKFVICGDNVCSGGTFPSGEDCETCPADCGSCSGVCGNNYCGPNETCSTCAADCGTCPTCPTDLGEEEVTVLISIVSVSWQCMQDVFNPYALAYYDYSQLNYKRYRVHRVRECDGTITETIVPGSTVYFTNYCYRYTYFPCLFGFGSPGCVFF